MAETSGRLRGIRQKLNGLRVPELRNILVDMNLTRSGRKIDMIERIADALEQFERKANDNASNSATLTFYTDQLDAGLRSIDAQIRLSRPAHASTTRYAPPPPIPPPPTLPSVAAPQRNHHHHPSSYHHHPPHAYGAPASSYAATPMPYNSYNSNNHRYPMPIPPPPGATGYATATGLPRPQYGSTQSTSFTYSGGVEVLKPRFCQQLEQARCFCAQEATSGRIIRCVQCDLPVHAKCHQLIAEEKIEWYCEQCRAKIFDPFLKVIRTIVEPQFVKFTKPMSSYRFEFLLPDRDLNDIYNKRGSTPACWELQLRCFAMKDELANGHCWPPSSQVNVNGFNVPITQRAPPGHSNPSKVLREIPANVFPFARASRNTLEVRTGEHPSLYAFMIQVVEIQHIDTLVKQVVTTSEPLTYEEARNAVIKSFGGDDDDDDDDDGVVALSTVLSLRCPLGLCVINMPARGLHCKHLQCFDLKTFLQFNKSARSKPWRCTICHNFIKVSDLRIDPYLKKLLSEVANDDELEEVEILPDATWKKKLAEKEESSPPSKRQRVKEEVTAEVPSAPMASTTTAATDAIGSSATAPVEIDLSLTSDEEDEPQRSPASSPAPATAGATSISTTAPSTLPSSSAAPLSSVPNDLSDLLAEDPSVLTVDSDIWESTSSANTTQLVSGSSLFDLPPTSGNASLSFPFPLDDRLFASTANPPATSTSTSTGSRWDGLYGDSSSSSGGLTQLAWASGASLAQSNGTSNSNSTTTTTTTSRSARPRNDQVICLLDSDSD